MEEDLNVVELELAMTPALKNRFSLDTIVCVWPEYDRVNGFYVGKPPTEEA